MSSHLPFTSYEEIPAATEIHLLTLSGAESIRDLKLSEINKYFSSRRNLISVKDEYEDGWVE